MAEPSERPMERPHSPAVQRLAERYGMTPDAIEQIISGTSSIREPAALESVNAEPVIVEAPQTVAATDARPDRRLPRENPRVATHPPRDPKSGPGLTIALAVVVLIGLAVALSFKKGCYSQRSAVVKFKPNATDTLQRLEAEAAQKASEPPTPSPVTPPQVPPEALVAPKESPKGTIGPPSSAGATTMQEAIKESQKSAPHSATPKPALTTSSSLEAEERLAELHASGSRKAKIVVKGSGSRKTYSVYKR